MHTRVGFLAPRAHLSLVTPTPIPRYRMPQNLHYDRQDVLHGSDFYIHLVLHRSVICWGPNKTSYAKS